MTPAALAAAPDSSAFAPEQRACGSGEDVRPPSEAENVVVRVDASWNVGLIPARPELIFIEPWLPAGYTQSGIQLEHHESIPRMFGWVRAVRDDCPVQDVKVGQLLAVIRYSGETIYEDDSRGRRLEVMSVNDVLAIVPLEEFV